MTDPRLWDGSVLGDLVGLHLFHDSDSHVSIMAAKSESAEAIVHGDQMAEFLQKHDRAWLVCQDAAFVFWAFRDVFQRGQPQCLPLLEDLVDRNQIQDVTLLDQRCRLVMEGVFAPQRDLERLYLHYCGRDANRSTTEQSAAPPPTRLPPAKDMVERAAKVLAVYKAIREPAKSLAEWREQAAVPPSDVNAAAGDAGSASEDTITPGMAAAAACIAAHAAAVKARFGEASGAVAEDAGEVVEDVPAAAGDSGPFGGGIDVKGAIAAHLMVRLGVCIVPESLIDVDQKAKDEYDAAIRALASDEHARHVFAPDGRRVRQDGSLSVDSAQLTKWLWHIFEGFCDVHNARWLEPLGEAGEISTNPRHWDVLARCSRLLQAWATLVAAGRAQHWIRENDSECHIQPVYEIVPTLRSSIPDLEYLRSLGLKCVPRSDHKFLVASVDHLELRCFAHNCGLRYHRPDVYLAWLFRDGDDPIALTAERLYDLASTGDTSTEVSFDKLKRMSPGDHSRWIKTATILLFAVPRCLSITQVRELLRAEVDPAMGEATVQNLYDNLVHKIHRELEFFLEDTTLETLKNHCDASVSEILDRMSPGEAVPENPGAFLRNFLAGKRDDERFWSMLRPTARGEWARTVAQRSKGRREAYYVLRNSPYTLSGYVGRPAYCTHSRGAEHVLLADETRKKIAYCLAVAGYTLVAVAGDEFVIEMPDGGEIQQEEIRSVVHDAVEETLSDVGLDSCHCQEASVW
ncbi:MAG: hypothetical protein NTY19_09070 [Planctomycetota bacterium]|nr:hypothetical protein [Planctomycetota bacterium]